MQQPSRRSLLLGTGSALALGVAGCLGRAAPSEQSETNDDATTLPSGLSRALEYVYSFEDGTIVRISRPVEDAEADAIAGQPSVPDESEMDWAVFVISQSASQSGDEPPEQGSVAVGTFDVDADDEELTADGSRDEFDTYTVDSRGGRANALATDGEVLLRGSADWVESTLASYEAGEATYVEEHPGATTILEEFEFGGHTFVTDNRRVIEEGFEHAEIEPERLPDVLGAEMVRSEDTLRYTLAAWYEDAPGAGDVETMEALVQSNLGGTDASVELREGDGLVVVESTREYTPPEEQPEAVGVPMYEEYDEATDEVRFRFDEGDSLPVERYEIEIDDRVYDGDWARGRQEIGEGDVIAIDADAIEPGDHLTISYEAPDGGYGGSTGTSALRRLPFEVDFDADARTVTVTYGDGPPLPADRVGVVVGDDERVHRPWNGELVEGDATTISDLPMDARLAIEYERSDGETVRIGGGSLGAPGHFEFDYDGRARTLQIRYPDLAARMEDRPRRARRHVPDQEPLDASRYEVTVDGEPAGRQLHDLGEEIEPGDALALEGVPVDTAVSVVWTSEEGQRYEVSGTRTVPDVEFEFAYDEASEEVTVRHAGGQAVDPAPLGVEIHADGIERSVDWDANGSVTAGDEFVVEDVGEDALLEVTYRDRHLDYAHVRRLLAEQ